METRLIINNTSQELFLAALKTIALPPVQAEIELAYTKIDRFCGVHEGVSNHTRYLALCRKHNAIPLRVKFQYDHNKDIFFLHDQDFFFNRPQTEEDAKITNECVMQGGKINMLSFEIRNPPAEKGLETLLKTHVKKLLTQEYNFYMIDVVLSYADVGDSVADTSLFYMSDSLNLRIGCNIENKDAAKLTRWFKKLQKKYEK